MPNNLVRTDQIAEAVGKAMARSLTSVEERLLAKIAESARPLLEATRQNLRVSKDAVAKADHLLWREDKRNVASSPQPSAAATLTRAIVVQLKALKHGRGAAAAAPAIAADLYPGDHDVRAALGGDLKRLVARAAAPPQLVGDYSSLLNPTVPYGGLLPSLAPSSTYTALAARGLRLSFSGIERYYLPGYLSGSLAGDFVAEGAPIPLARLTLTSSTIGPPKKMAIASTFTAELAERSTPNIEAFLRDRMQRDTTALLDTRMLDSNPAAAKRPAGLLNGITPLAATTGGGTAALAGDLSALAAAIPSPSDLVYLMTPGDRIRALAFSPGLLAATIIAAPNGLAAKQIVALDAADLVTAEGDAPRFALSENAAMHYDTAPTPLSAFGTVPGTDPNVVAAPIISTYQQDEIALRLIVRVLWAMRQPGRIATITGITW